MRIETTSASLDAKANRCRRKFLRLFPGGFDDETYRDWERDYKVEAHTLWREQLSRAEMARLLAWDKPDQLAARAVRIESRTNLLFSFEKMALRDAVRSRRRARIFGQGLYQLLHGRGSIERRFQTWIEAVAALPRRQTRVLTWPLLTVFPWLAQPEEHVFLKPLTTKRAAEAYGFPFLYSSKPSWPTYASLLAFASRLERDLADWRPKDRIDIQGFIWVIGSDEYA